MSARPDPVLSTLLARVEALVRSFGEQACADVWEALALTVALRPFPSQARRERLFDLWRQRRRWRVYRRRQRFQGAA